MCISTTFSNNYAVDIDLRDALTSWDQAVQETAPLSELPKGILEGDIYETSYARAELQIAAPAVEALEATYAYIAQRCDGKLAVTDVTTIFALTTPGKELTEYLKRRNIVDDFTESERYAQSCINIVTCFNDAILTEDQKKKIVYENSVRTLCEDIVEHGYEMMATSIVALSTMQDMNYGDDMLFNAKIDDGPFDILYDIEQVGNVLFAHNDPATEIHFFDIQPPSSYVTNYPNAVTPYATEVPNSKENDALRRLPATSGIDPYSPRSVYYTDSERVPEAVYTAPNEPRTDFSKYTDTLRIGGSPQENKALQNAIGPANELPSAVTLKNALCVIPEEELEEDELDIFSGAVLQQEHTYAYNKKLDLSTRVALASAAIMAPELEEKYGIDPVEILEEVNIDPTTLPDLITDASKGTVLEDMKNALVNCVEQFTQVDLDGVSESGEKTAKIDANTAGKVIWKSITQPTALTQCVMDILCFEITDPTGRGLYRIQGCTVPSRRAYGVADNQQVVSIEEAVDEFLNVCTSLKESGQLLEHNKTKDARDHKLMRVNFADKFSFSLSVGFKGLTDQQDPAYEKRIARENNAYLMNALIGIEDNLGLESQRNRYVGLYNRQTASVNGLNSIDQNIRQNTAQQLAETAGDEITYKEERSQLQTSAAILDVLDSFIDLNINYRGTLNDTTHSIMQNRQAEMKESQKKK